MDERQRRHDSELITILENLEKSYNPNDPKYKFTHVFYNVVNGPFERPPSFPQNLWNQALLPDRSLMPVILTEQQIVERKRLQEDLARKLSGAYIVLQRRIDSLKAKKEDIMEKLKTICKKYRALSRQYALGEPVEDVYKLKLDSYSREPYVVGSGYEDLISYLFKMNKRLHAFESRIDDCLFDVKRQQVEKYKLDK